MHLAVVLLFSSPHFNAQIPRFFRSLGIVFLFAAGS